MFPAHPQNNKSLVLHGLGSTVITTQRKIYFDPHVWSGRALQEVFVDLVVSGLASMYPASDWSFCSGPSWISARMRSH